MSLRKEITDAIKELSAKNLIATINEELGKYANNIVSDAKQNIKANGTSNNGFLINSIGWTQEKDLEIEVFAGMPYAPFIEFGTKGYAAKYVSSLPKEWQDFAKQFKGEKQGGTFDKMIDDLSQWVKERGIAGEYSVKTKKRKGNFLKQALEDRQTAYVLAKWILINGIKPKPYLYPAVVKNQKIFQETINKIFK